MTERQEHLLDVLETLLFKPSGHREQIATAMDETLRLLDDVPEDIVREVGRTARPAVYLDSRG